MRTISQRSRLTTLKITIIQHFSSWVSWCIKVAIITWWDFSCPCTAKIGLLERDLADRFGVPKSTVSRIFTSWIRLLWEELEPLIVWPSKEQIFHHIPAAFKAKYPDVVVIIDCTEIKMECPSGLENHSACYSYYKSNTTMKGLVGITPAGVCFFVSDLYAVSIFFW